jgi:hypothetical protein
MEFPKALYKAPGPHDIHGHLLDYATAADAGDLAAAKAAGWHESTHEAVAAYEAEQAAVQAKRVEEANAQAAAQANAQAEKPKKG